MSIQEVVLPFFPILVGAVSLLLYLFDEVIKIHYLLEIDTISFINDPNLLLSLLPFTQIPHNILHLRDLLINQLRNLTNTFFLLYNLKYSLCIFLKTLF